MRKVFKATGRQAKIFNTYQGSQFSSKQWVKIESKGIKVSMDGKGCWRDSVFIEGLWRSIKHEKIRLWTCSNVPELEALIDDWMELYYHRRRHQSLSNHTSWSVYQETQRKAA